LMCITDISKVSRCLTYFSREVVLEKMEDWEDEHKKN
jgi:hypothetical protein